MTKKYNTITVSVADAKIATIPDSVLVTYALGSCIGVALYDPVEKIGGLLHFQLPYLQQQDDHSHGNPFKYADSGFESLLEKLLSLGANKKSLVVKIAGGAKILASKSDSFDIGKNNHIAIRKILWKKGMMIRSQDIGGNIPRTMYFDLSDGKVTIKSHGKTIKVM
jgi:chemotaxis protein CheD